MDMDLLDVVDNHLQANPPNAGKNKATEEYDERYEHLKDVLRPNSTPLGNIGDLIYGFGKVGSKIAHSFNKNAPEMPYFGKGEPSPVWSGAGQMLPAVLSGGSTLAGQTVAAGGLGALQAEPDEETMLSKYAGLPEGRVTAGLQDALSVALGGRLLEQVPKIPGAVKKGYNYLHPEKETEAFRASLGQGTSKENIAELGKRVQYGQKAREEESLIPKRELYAQEGKSDVYKVNPQDLPEGNLQGMAHIINPEDPAFPVRTGQGYKPDQFNALSKAIGDFRKGKVDRELGGHPLDTFKSKVEDIFNIEELPEKAAAKLEDALSLPTKRDSRYFGDEDVSSAYSKKGKIISAHQAYEEKPTLQNYDALQSAIKKEQRKLSKREKAGTISPEGESRLEQLNANIENLNADKESFMKTLPENMQSLENEFRTKYATGVGPYKEAPLTMRKLAGGKAAEVTSAQVAKLFTNPTKETLHVLKDIGPAGARNILYNALQKVEVNDAEGLAKTILDLKRTKGYDQFIDDKMVDWANNMLHQAKWSGRMKEILKTGTGAGLGAAAGSILGPGGTAAGATIGSALAHGPEIAKFLSKFRKK